MPKLTVEEEGLLAKTGEQLTRFTGHPGVQLTGSGNGAIFAALALAKDAGARRVLIPDQGGWYSFKSYPELLGLEIEELPTDAGILNAESVEDACRREIGKRAVLLVPSFAGYFFELDIHELAAACHESGGLLIEDVTAALPDRQDRSGAHADFMVASFGRDKPVNLGYGGMVSSRFGFETDHSTFSLSTFHPSFLEPLIIRLSLVESRYSWLLEQNRKIQKELQGESIREILHPDRRGINILVACDGRERERAVAFCHEHELPYIGVPRYHRAKIKGISIEVKRLSEENHGIETT